MKKILILIIGTILTLVIFISSMLYDQSCKNIFRKELITYEVSSIEVNLKNSYFTTEDSDEIKEIVDSLNSCPRENAAEISFEKPSGRLLFKRGDDGKAEHLTLKAEDHHYAFLFKGYLINSNYKFHLP
ncbi:hypothetical protein ACJROX_23580 [Pseudalkalibacillus sp. A8]|uniref:hypothetical protein n=1 Tax=Pseudalkalibacillus sp. A8 TaxID=3382641 RepID=UPI0038B4FEF0